MSVEASAASITLDQTAPTSNVITQEVAPTTPAKEEATAANPAPSTEAQTEKPKEESAEWNARFTALARKEKDLARKAAEIRQRDADENFKLFQAARQSKNPVQALQALGMTFNDAAQFVLNDGKEKPKTAEEKVEELRKSIEEMETKRQAEAARAQQEQIDFIINGHKQQIRETVDADSEKYEMIKANDAYETVFDVIEEYFNKNKVVLPIEKAAEHVENYLTEHAKKLLRLKKLQALPTETPAAPTQAAPKSTAPQMTLTNRNVTAMPAKENLGRLSKEESIKRAAAMLRWT